MSVALQDKDTPAEPRWVRELSVDDRAILDVITAPARPKLKRGQWVNEGFRFFCLGDSDAGKTSLMRAVIYYTIAMRWANFAFVHDTKSPIPEYPKSLMFPTVDHFRARGFQDGDIPVASFRGAPRFDMVVEAEDVGRLSKEHGQRGVDLPDGTWTINPHVLVVEELAKAASDGRKQVAAPSVLWALEQGRMVGVSTLGTTQSPRKLPLDFFSQATSIAFFRLTGADINYLENAEFDPAMLARLRGEGNVGLPKHQFAIYVKGEPWDGKIHCLSEKTALMFE